MGLLSNSRLVKPGALAIGLGIESAAVRKEFPVVLGATYRQREGNLAEVVCTHVQDHVKAVKPSAKGCEDCLRTGDTWVHLRMCLECGYVGCCDSSKNRHARAHFASTHHPITQSAERGEKWRWCYVDEVYLG